MACKVSIETNGAGDATKTSTLRQRWSCTCGAGGDKFRPYDDVQREANAHHDAAGRGALHPYEVTTEKFGVVSFMASSIEDARADAKLRFRVKNPSAVRRVVEYKLCAQCDSKPCCCKGAA